MAPYHQKEGMEDTSTTRKVGVSSSNLMTAVGTWTETMPKLLPKQSGPGNDNHILAMGDCFINGSSSDLNTPEIKLDEDLFFEKNTSSHNDCSLDAVSEIAHIANPDRVARSNLSDNQVVFDLSPAPPDLQSDYFMDFQKFTAPGTADGFITTAENKHALTKAPELDLPRPRPPPSPSDFLTDIRQGINPQAEVGIMKAQSTSRPTLPQMLLDDGCDFKIPTEILEQMSKLFPDALPDDVHISSTELDMCLGMQEDLLSGALHQCGIPNEEIFSVSEDFLPEVAMEVAQSTFTDDISHMQTQCTSLEDITNVQALSTPHVDISDVQAQSPSHDNIIRIQDQSISHGDITHNQAQSTSHGDITHNQAQSTSLGDITHNQVQSTSPGNITHIQAQSTSCDDTSHNQAQSTSCDDTSHNQAQSSNCIQYLIPVIHTDNSQSNFPSSDYVSTHTDQSKSFLTGPAPVIPTGVATTLGSDATSRVGPIRVTRQRRSARKPVRFRDSDAFDESVTTTDLNITVEYPGEQTGSGDTTTRKEDKLLQRELTDREKYHRIRVLNNEASKRCREKRKKTMKEMEEEMFTLEERNQKLKEKEAALRRLRDKLQAFVSEFFSKQFASKE
ncbi:uncharacterized protein [Panulirus ornatus]